MTDKTPEANRALVTRLLEEAFNGRRLELLEEVLAPDFVMNPLAAFPPEKEHGPEGMRGLYQAFYAAMPDVKAEVISIVAEGDRVMVIDNFGGTMTGQLGPHEPTGKRLSWSVAHLYRIRDGKIAEDNVLVDALGLLTQVGAIKA